MSSGESTLTEPVWRTVVDLTERATCGLAQRPLKLHTEMHRPLLHLSSRFNIFVFATHTMVYFCSHLSYCTPKASVLHLFIFLV